MLGGYCFRQEMILVYIRQLRVGETLVGLGFLRTEKVFLPCVGGYSSDADSICGEVSGDTLRKERVKNECFIFGLEKTVVELGKFRKSIIYLTFSGHVSANIGLVRSHSMVKVRYTSLEFWG